MATRNIQMNYYNGTNYDVLYPQSTIAQISNLQSSLNSKLNLSGGTMTGNLMLNGDPSNGLQAATKQYVDTVISKKFTKETLRTFQFQYTFTGTSGEIRSVATDITDSQIKEGCGLGLQITYMESSTLERLPYLYFSSIPNYDLSYGVNIVDTADVGNTYKTLYTFARIDSTGFHTFTGTGARTITSESLSYINGKANSAGVVNLLVSLFLLK